MDDEKAAREALHKTAYNLSADIQATIYNAAGKVTKKPVKPEDIYKEPARPITEAIEAAGKEPENITIPYAEYKKLTSR